MNQNSVAKLGVIEGFFGRSWSWQDRHNYADFLANSGYHYYIYAPKSDSFLRKNWQLSWPRQIFNELQQLRESYAKHQLQFGIGLSPFEIYLDSSRNNHLRLLNKIDELNQLQPDILCLLFDDMRGDLPKLAELQIELVHRVAERSTAKQIIFCPTYYSFDPVLEKVFGCRPGNYWKDIGKDLDSTINIFWTGPQVCSENYPVEHLQQVSDLLQRKPFLWDNYPVNDGAAKSRLLQLRSFSASHGQLTNSVSGHAVNPMNQPWLSRIPLSTLPQAYNEQYTYKPEQAFIHACQQLCGDPLAEYLIHDISLFQDQGLGQLNEEDRARLREKYRPFDSSPYAQEIISWLNNEYAFDPACLTE